jgi:branched-chain amino acid transport system permease protein
MDYIIHLLIIVSIYSSLSISLNLLVGFTGILSVTHAAFYGIGAYATAILMKTLGYSFLASVGLGMLITLCFALFVGFVLSRVKGDYYALGSFGFNVIVYSILLNWETLTKGPLGIFGIPRPEIAGFTFTSNISFLGLTIIICLLIVALSFYITRSSFGRVLRAIRDDEEVLLPFGLASSRYKLTIFSIAALMASLCGSLYATYISFIDPSSFTLNESIFILTIIILGGLASIRGSIIGAVVLVLLPEVLRFIGLPNEIAAQMRVVIYGIALVYLMYARPSGIYGKYSP